MVDTTLAQAQRMSAPRAIALCQCFNGALEFQAGQWDKAEKELRESIRLYSQIGAASGEAIARQRLGLVLTAKGQLDEAKAVLQEGAAVAERAIMRAHCLTRVYATLTHNRLVAGDMEGANQALGLGLSMSERHGNCSTCNALLLPVAVGVRIAQNDLEEAAVFAGRLEAAAQEYGSQMWRAMAEQSRAELLAVQGNIEEAILHYENARQGFVKAGNHYEAMRCEKALEPLRS
ncbi:MAG TPA: tetratricopeptide repeat protein [Anaerolineales bacterium]